MSGSVIDVTAQTWQSEVINSEKLTLVDFWAEWCGPCRMLGPTLKAIQSDRDDVKIVKVDIEKESGVANQFRVSNIPFMVLFKNGQVVDQMLGNQPRKKIEDLISRNL